MPVRHKSTSRREPAVGDRVRIDFGGPREMVATVIEDRGNLGVGGRRILRMKFDEPYGISFELPADDVRLISKCRTSPRSKARRARTSAK